MTGQQARRYSAQGYEGRAGECIRLADQAPDLMVQVELLKLRQTFLTVAQRLREREAPLCEPRIL